MSFGLTMMGMNGNWRNSKSAKTFIAIKITKFLNLVVMKNTLYKIYLIPILLISLMIGGLTSCQKYEEGPSFSLQSKLARLTQEWQVLSIGEIVAGPNDNLIIFEFARDRDFTFTSTSNDGSSDISNGTWRWLNDKEEVRLTFENHFSDLLILKLTNDEFWFTFDGNEWKLEKY